jgi:hypothetical protein
VYISDRIHIKEKRPMAGKPGKAGRPQSTKDYFKILLRVPPGLQGRIEHCHALLQRQHGPKTTQTEALWHVLEAGCDAIEQTLEGREIPMPISKISELSLIQISKISTISGEDISVPGYGFPEDEDEDETPAPASPTNGTRAPEQAVPVPQVAATPAPAAVKTAPALSETIVKIAEARAQDDKLSEREFAQRLFDRGIYRHRAKDGSEVRIPHTTLRQWLKQARDAGAL